MLLVLCVDRDDDLGRKTDFDTPVVGRSAVQQAATALATADPEDSDVNVLFKGLQIIDHIADEPATLAVVTGTEGDDVLADRHVGNELDTVLASLDSHEDLRAIVVTDGAQDEGVLPVIRSRLPIDGVRRVVVRQVQDLESVYYTVKQVLDDPETRGTILIPLGILLLVYPLAILASYFDLPGSVFGVTSGLLGLYLLARGFGITDVLETTVDRLQQALYTGRVTIVTYLVAVALLVIGGASGLEQLEIIRSHTADPLTVSEIIAALVYGAVQWFAAAGITTSLGQITDEYLANRLEWRYLNAPFYVIAIAVVLHGVSSFFLGVASLTYLAAALTGGFLLGVGSTLAFAVAEARHPDRSSSTR